jgi:NADH-quinone oxidoreductase subunit C
MSITKNNSAFDNVMGRLSALGASLMPSEKLPGGHAIRLPKDKLIEGMNALKEAGFTRLSYLTAVDWHEKRAEFELLYFLHSLSSAERLGVKVSVERSQPTVHSVSHIWLAADWYERELYDLFGIRFQNHPDLRRILMPEDWMGHPLRKDYPLTEEPVHFLDRSAPRLPSELIPKKYAISPAQAPAAPPVAPATKPAAADANKDKPLA